MLRPIDCADEVVLMTGEIDVRTYVHCTYELVQACTSSYKLVQACARPCMSSYKYKSLYTSLYKCLYELVQLHKCVYVASYDQMAMPFIIGLRFAS